MNQNLLTLLENDQLSLLRSQEAVLFCLRNGADPNLCEPGSEMTVLMEAGLSGNYEFFKELLEIPNLKVDQTDNFQRTALWWICFGTLYTDKNVQKSMVQLLLEKGANPSLPNKALWTPAQTARMRNNFKLADLLERNALLYHLKRGHFKRRNIVESDLLTSCFYLKPDLFWDLIDLLP